jgi:hypothetical protein
MRGMQPPSERSGSRQHSGVALRRWPRAVAAGGFALLAVALLLHSIAPSRAQTTQSWTDGDVLTAEALNAAFDDLRDQIRALWEAPVALDPSDTRHDDLRWALLHAAAVGACASNSTRALTSTVVPRTPGADCTDICEAVFVAADTDLPLRLECFGAVSVGQIATQRATGPVHVGYGRRDSCAESEEEPDPNAFEEVNLQPDAARERLLNGFAQYCCCGDATVRPAPETCSGDC